MDNKPIPGFFETASFHPIKPCNMKCKFCYATFEDIYVPKQLSKEDAFVILDKLKAAGLQKITFAGGEPLLYRWIFECIEYSKEIGLVTSIITNGYLLSNSLLDSLLGKLDWIGISVDSLNNETNHKIGRVSKDPMDYYLLIDAIKSRGFKLKINTVVNRYNEQESMQSFIDYANPMRWKIFDTLRIDGQNDTQFEGIRTSDNGFETFLNNHNHGSMVVENNEAMTGSYLLIDPRGCLFENSLRSLTYSSPLQSNSMEKCLSEINLDRDMFVKRGGIYEW